MPTETPGNAAKESRQDRKARLTKEGRWNQYVEERLRLTEGGMTSKQAESLLVSDFGPDSGPVIDGMAPMDIRAARLAPFSALARAARGKTASAKVCVAWAADNRLFGPDEIDPESVPSPGAASMYELAHNNSATFWVYIYPRHMATEGDMRNPLEDTGETAATLARAILKTLPIEPEESEDTGDIEGELADRIDKGEVE